MNSENITKILTAISAGDEDAGQRLFTIVYTELHTLAHRAVQREGRRRALQTTDLLHETYLRLLPKEGCDWQSRTHFFRTAGKVMRHILIQEARRRKAAKRGYGRTPVSLADLNQPFQDQTAKSFTFEDLDALEKALEKLEAHEIHGWMATIVDLRFFAGLTFEKIAEYLGVAKSTVIRDWSFIRAWLHQEIGNP